VINELTTSITPIVTTRNVSIQPDAPPDLKYVNLTDPDKLVFDSARYPVLEWGGYTYWGEVISSHVVECRVLIFLKHSVMTTIGTGWSFWLTTTRVGYPEDGKNWELVMCTASRWKMVELNSLGRRGIQCRSV